MYKITIRMRTLALVLSIFGFLPSAVGDDQPVLSGYVTRVVDGDTIDVKMTSGPIRVRLHGIDAPEKTQPHGNESAAALANLVLNKPIEIEPFEQDRYERLIGIVYIAKTNINAEMVRQGHAWAYRRYMRKADAQLCSFEHQARLARRGLWATQMEDFEVHGSGATRNSNT